MDQVLLFLVRVERTAVGDIAGCLVGVGELVERRCSPWSQETATSARCDVSGAVDCARIQRVFEGWAQATGKRIDEKKAMAPENQSIERLVDPDDIAALAVFLASDAVVNLDAADR